MVIPVMGSIYLLKAGIRGKDTTIFTGTLIRKAKAFLEPSQWTSANVAPARINLHLSSLSAKREPQIAANQKARSSL